MARRVSVISVLPCGCDSLDRGRSGAAQAPNVGAVRQQINLRLTVQNKTYWKNKYLNRGAMASPTEAKRRANNLKFPIKNSLKALMV
jgi:hypothetical protein